MPRARDECALAADLALQHWARVFCGRLGLEHAQVQHDRIDTTMTPDLDLAERVERELIVMKRRRRRYFDAIMYRYRNRWMDVSCAEAMRMSVPTYRLLMRQAYTWLDARLAT